MEHADVQTCKCSYGFAMTYARQTTRVQRPSKDKDGRESADLDITDVSHFIVATI